MKALLGALGLSGAGLVAMGCVVVDSQGHIVRDEKRFTVSGPLDLKLTTFDGAIEIRSTDEKQVVVEIEKRGPTQESVERLQVDATQNGNQIAVEVKKPEGSNIIFGIGRNMYPTAKLIVTMPPEGNVTARSGDGSIRIEHVRGRLELRTGDGSIRATEVTGQLSFATGDGSVIVDGADGDLEVETGDGGVTVAGKLASLRAHTGDGSITLRAQPGTVMKDDWSITTGDGGVAVYLPSNFDAEIDAHTGDGSIRSELKLTADSGASRRNLRGRLGDGGKTLRIRTGDGSIRLNVS
jgi:hypothetical protein